MFDGLAADAGGSQQGGGQGEREDIYSGLSDGEIEEPDAYSDISSDENFLDSLNDDQRMVRLSACDVTTHVMLMLLQLTCDVMLQADLQEIDVSDDSWNFAISNFNAYQCDLIPMEVSG